MSDDSRRLDAVDDGATTIDREDAEAAYHHARSLIVAHLTTLPSVVDSWSGEDEGTSPDDMVARMCVIARDHSTGEEPFGELLETTRVKTLESFADRATTDAMSRLSRLLEA